MRIAKRTLIFAMLILVVVGSAGAGKSRRMTANQSRATVSELLEKHAQVQDKLEHSFISKAEKKAVCSYNYPYKNTKINNVKRNAIVEWRSDGNRMKIIKKEWGFVNPGKLSDCSKDSKAYVSQLWDGDKFYAYSKRLTKGDKDMERYPGILSIDNRENKDSIVKGQRVYKLLNHTEPFCYYYTYSSERLDKVILQDRNAFVHNKMETVGRSKCYVISGTAKNGGAVKIWLDPQHGYNIAKYQWKVGEGYITPNGKRYGKHDFDYCSGEVSSFKKIDGIWAPVEITTVNILNHPSLGGSSHNMREHWKRLALVMNPDHDTLGSFLHDDIINGAIVNLKTVRGIEYIWQDGKIVDKDGKIVLDCRKKQKAKKTDLQVEEKSMSEKEMKQRKYQYLLFLPEGYGQGREKWPLILFLHGKGERGDDLELVKKHGVAKIVETDKKFGFVVVSPQCPGDEWWSNDKLKLLLDEITAEYDVDEKRIYLTGLSMGGKGTWDLACAYPDRFAAIAPVCGWGEPEKAGNIKNMPIWAFHGAEDKTVPISKDQVMVDAVKACGGNIKFTIYPYTGHDCWTVTYENNELYDWFLKHRRNYRR